VSRHTAAAILRPRPFFLHRRRCFRQQWRSIDHASLGGSFWLAEAGLNHSNGSQSSICCHMRITPNTSRARRLVPKAFSRRIAFLFLDLHGNAVTYLSAVRRR
jgi:hypothetical protein